MMMLDRREVYRVRSEQDPTAVIALDAKLEDNVLSWFDTQRDRGHVLASENPGLDNHVFVTEEGWSYSFTIMTNDVYEAEVRAHVENAPHFENTAALREFYLEKFLD